MSNGQSFPVSLQDLPTAVELLKTKNDSDCVKGGEVGQVRHMFALQHTDPLHQ